MSKAKLPQTLYIYRGYSLDMESWYMVEETIRDCADTGEPHLVGVYELQELKNVSLKLTEELIVDDAKD